MRWIVALLACVFAVAAQAGDAQAVSIFGLKLGEPLNLKRCPGLHQALKAGPCYSRDPSAAKVLPNVQEGWVHFPFEEIPRWINTNGLTVLLVDGKLERVWIMTNGWEAKGPALRDLTEKFGKPVGAKTTTMSNGYGARFDAPEAHWQTGDVGVHFYGVVEGTSKGTVTIATSKGAQTFNELRQATNKQRRL